MNSTPTMVFLFKEKFKKSDRVRFATGIGMLHPSLAGCGWDSLVEGCCL